MLQHIPQQLIPMFLVLVLISREPATTIPLQNKIFKKFRGNVGTTKIVYEFFSQNLFVAVFPLKFIHCGDLLSHSNAL